ncbi:MAG: 3-phosphoshikimate 1-carboxyvinyltransferase, partial [Propionibacterium sp.]|nr:3-phosphoshikimate 1-carboxyvinyltransferase [Propionibacterium sp.]
MTTQTTWAVPRAPHELTGRVVVPGSKSQTNRALLLAATSNSDSVLDGVLRCRDSELMMAGLQALGARFSVPAPGR